MDIQRNLIAAFRAHCTCAPLNFSCYIFYTVTIGRYPYQQLININFMSDETTTPEETTEEGKDTSAE